MIKKYLEAGKIVGTHGLKGELRVEVWCDTIEVFCSFERLYYNEGEEEIKIKSKVHKRIAISKIEGIDTVEQADMLRGKILYLNREDLELKEGEYFIQDLIGVKIRDKDSKEEFGAIVDVIKTGANDVYEMKGKDNKSILIPVIDEIIKEVDIEEGIILIKPMKGLFGDED